jgi:hypothetical protein
MNLSEFDSVSAMALILPQDDAVATNASQTLVFAEPRTRLWKRRG